MSTLEQSLSELTKKIADAYYNRGNFFYNDWYSVKHTVGIPEKAIADLEKAIELYAEHVKSAPHNLHMYSENIKYPQEYIDALFLLVEIYTRVKKEPDIARGYLDEIVKIKGHEQNRALLRRIAGAFEKLGDQEKSNEYFNKAGRLE